MPLLECNGIQAAGLLAMYLGFIAEAVAVLMLIFHSLALADMVPRASVRPLGMLIWGTLTLGFMIGDSTLIRSPCLPPGLPPG